jgi:uncharacterized protein YndB with AHSA1/START domain
MTPQPQQTDVDEDVLVKTIRIDARPETVFAFFTEADKATEWLCEEATLDARPGGICRQVHRDEEGKLHEMVGEFTEVTPVSRVVFTWGFEELALDPRTSRVEVDLEPDGDGTVLTLSHYAPSRHRADHEHGWSILLPRLVEAAAKAS